MKQLLLILLLSISAIGLGQNLVPNPSFENYSGCPTSPGSIGQSDSLLFWFNVSPGPYPPGGSPDYFHQCSSEINNVPNAYFGYQQAKSGGAYVGLIVRQDTINFREYMEVQLTTPLIGGSSYLFEVYANVPNDFEYGSKDIQVYFSDTAIIKFGSTPLPHSPQISSLSGLNPDTTNWSLLSGCYTASGGEQFMLIGNFKDAWNTSYYLINSNNTWQEEAYLYIDDVSLTAAPTCANGTSDYNQQEGIPIYPNPTLGNINISLEKNQNATVTIYNFVGKAVTKKQFNTNNIQINMNVPAGLYFVQVETDDGIFTQKIIKE